MNEFKKIMILGNAGVGKTCLINRRFNNNFGKKYIPTNNIDIKHFNDYIIYDFPGQNVYGSHNINVQDIKVCIVMYDVTNKKSYNNINFWMLKVEELCGSIPIIIVGNKIDCVFRKVRDNTTINISVKTQENIQGLFEVINEHF